MVKLFDVNEQNWLDIASLSVSNDQKRFLDRPIGILARGYAYRLNNARVIGISNNDDIIGVALVKDMDEEPACYDLQQFMIDVRYQNKGYGTEALRLILLKLSQEGKYNQAEVCVHKEDSAALWVYNKIGFVDTGYIDENVPYCYNLMYHFYPLSTLTTSQSPCLELSSDESEQSTKNQAEHPAENCGAEATYSDKLISDFSDPLFQKGFKEYFSEMAVNVRDWGGLFREMNDDGDNAAFVRTTENGELVGFLQFKPIKFTSCFFEETYGFIREFWIAGKFRKNRHGTALISLAEKHFVENGICTSILTTDSAANFYEKLGYVKAPGCRAKNQYDVYVKRL